MSYLRREHSKHTSRRVYRTDSKEQAHEFANKYHGEVYEIFPDEYLIKI